ncbi:MAG: endonuclease/exonuclease/phosphatase family protein [Bdellovibrionaceae bacterium]|nr:endonuclease/exonuclease/phosphatase family protein [Pseudobdellovibrionaceae bacterium]MDW8190148.1 hypothetical protein [Pseudobdellovibrionaceae bacterium]
MERQNVQRVVSRYVFQGRKALRSVLLKLFLVLVLLHVLYACVSTPKNPFDGRSYPEGRVTVMSYNLENLFDTVHDQDREDFTFLPLVTKRDNDQVLQYCQKQKRGRRKECFELDWSEDVLKAKMKNLAQVVRQVYGKGPDILLVQEVENLSILKRFVNEELGDLGYQTVELLEGDDKRGVDVGLVSRYPKAGEARLHRIQWKEALKLHPPGTRGILEVPLQLPRDQVVHVFVLHFPSQANPTPFRVDAVNTLLTLLDRVPQNRFWIVGGDWNITPEEDEEYGFISRQLAQKGLVSHIIGCKRCKGTHNYRRDWSFFDILVFSPRFGASDSPLKVDADSIVVPQWAPGQARISGRPNRFDSERLTGASDHFPIYGELVWTSE